MGNSATKEQRPPPGRLRSTDTLQANGSDQSSPSFPPSQEHQSHPLYNVRGGRSSRPDLSALLGIRSGPASDTGLEGRRESKQEREARKLEKERIAREKERERSMREEHVDGGFLVTQGVYTGVEDYSKSVVRQLMIERRISPFWRGLNDFSDSWTENQLVAAARGRPIPAPDDIPTEYETAKPTVKAEMENINSLTIPISSRSQSFNSDSSSNLSPSQSTFPQGVTTGPSSSSGPTIFRGRAKTLAALTTSKNSQEEPKPREMQLPKDPYVSGQPIEAYLYKDATECPICFLYYPPYLNKTRCCDQAICSECFVQIKRPDPHPPEHADPTTQSPPSEMHPRELKDGEELVSEPAACPFCVQPEFGITYDPPAFRRGLTYVNQISTNNLANDSSAMSSASSLASALSNGGRMSPNAYRRRTTSLSASAPAVITTDRVRPDWHQKLAAARDHTARRSAAATALHTAAYLMGNRGQESDARGLGHFGRRGILRRTSGGDSPSGISSLNMLAMMTERYAAGNAAREEGEPSMTPGPRGSSRRNRVDDLEDMMLMEAIRLSLASEEDRRKREEKDAKKEAKKKEKESKKAEKVARKTGVYPINANQSPAGMEGTSSQTSMQNEQPSYTGKGKAPQVTNSDWPSDSMSAAEDAQEHLERARAQILPADAPTFTSPYSSSSYRPSHLRTLSNASSSTSSFEGSAPGSLRSDLRGRDSSFEISPNASGLNIPSVGSAQDTYISGTPPGGGAGMEPMFNFRSLAAMVGDEKSRGSSHQENISDGSSHCQRELPPSKADHNEQLKGQESTAAEYKSRTQADGTIQEETPSIKMDLPDVKITAATRNNSDFEKPRNDVEIMTIGDNG